MTELIILALLLSGAAAIAAYWRKARIRELARQRIEHGPAADSEAADVSQEPAPAARSILVRRRFAPWVVALVLAALLHFAAHFSLPFVIAISLIVGMLTGRLEAYLAGRQTVKIETQLADAIDLMVAALRAGASVPDALENAMRETHSPLLPQLEEVVGRIRYGDDPRTVYQGLTQRVPLETFLLFASALSVQAETGGSLAPTLASVGRTIRDRIEISRRIRTNSAQSEVSSLAVFLLTYFIALLVWRGNPQQMDEFLSTTGGQWAVATTILLQAAGVVWMAAISRMKF